MYRWNDAKSLPSLRFLISPVALALQAGTKISPVWCCQPWKGAVNYSACYFDEGSALGSATTNPALLLPPSSSSPSSQMPGSWPRCAPPGRLCRPCRGWREMGLGLCVTHNEMVTARAARFLQKCRTGAVVLSPASAAPGVCPGKGAATKQRDPHCCCVPSVSTGHLGHGEFKWKEKL